MPPDRRPLASRDTRIAQKLARALAQTTITPNQISQASMVFAGLAGLAFWLSAGIEGPWRWILLLVAALGCQLRLLCNLLDGMVAVEGGKGIPDGPFWNEAPDRISDILILVGMGLGVGLPALGWAAATVAVLVSYIRELGASSGQQADFRGPMAKPHRMATATFAALVAVFLPSIASVSVFEIALWAITLGGMVTATLRSRRLLSGLRDLSSARRDSSDP